MKKFYERKKEQFQKKLENVGSTKTIKNADIKTVEDLRELLFDHPGYFYRSDVIFYYYENDIIDEEIARSLLKDIQSAGIRHGEKSAFRGAVTYLSFKKYLIR